MRLGNYPTNSFAVRKRSWQECCGSSTLFNLYLNAEIQTQWRKKYHGSEMPIEDQNLYALEYADDQVVVAQDQDDMQYMPKKQHEE